MQADDLQKLTRGELIELARARGVPSADALTRAELMDEILQRPSDDEGSTGLFGFLGFAAELVADVVQSRLHMPEAAKLIREMTKPRRSSRPPPPLPTVTLAEIYAAQGHLDKALAVLDEVIATAPDHRDARALRKRLAAELAAAEAAEAAAQRAVEAPGATAGGGAEPPTAEAKTQAQPAAGSEPERNAEVEPPSTNDREPAGLEDEVAHSPAPITRGGSDAPLAGQPLPARYDVDEVVALGTDPRTAYVYWELRPERFAAARHADPTGQLVLRALTLVSRGLELDSDSRDIPVDALVGDRFISGLTPGAELRLCLGWNGPKGFVPLAIAGALQMSRDHDAPTPAVGPMDAVALAATPTATEATAPAGATATGPQATATHRLRSYQAQLASQRTAPGGMAAADQPLALGGPLVVNLSTAQLSAGSHGLGGASELYRVGAGARLGGASDLYGGASDLYGGASDLSKSP